jgi:hypothetical protein
VVHETKTYRLFERIIGNPEALHSGDWKSFYDEIGANDGVKKAWILCADLADVKQNKDQVAKTWGFFKDRHFMTRYCPPREIERAVGEKMPRYDAIEDYGLYVKRLLMPKEGYASGDEPNNLVTNFKIVEDNDRQLINSILECSTEIDEKWFSALRDETPTATTPAA